MPEYTDADIQQALGPLLSLLRKSEKAQQRLPKDSWQFAMLRRNIAALRVALTLLEGHPGDGQRPSPRELYEAAVALDEMIARVAQTERKFEVGTSQHSLQRNRLKALHVARSTVEQARS